MKGSVAIASNLFPVDILQTVEEVVHNQRPADGLLHASTDLVGSLRHSMLRAAGAPQIHGEFGQGMTLLIGTLVHRHLAQQLVERGVPFMQEVKLQPWMPEGWSGTADWIFYHPEYEAFVLGDLKTTKGESMRFLKADGAKIEHIHQLSAYWYALRNMGLPIIKGVGVLYLPKNETADKSEKIEPILHECDLIEEEVLVGIMESRWSATKKYLYAHRHEPTCGHGVGGSCALRCYLDDTLVPVQPRVQKVTWNGKGGVFDVKLEPHWSARYCSFPNELCDCSEQGATKIGHYTLEGEYVYRKEYEDQEPVVEPTEADYAKRRQ